MTEHADQCTLFEWAAIKSRQIPELEFLFAIPNGGFRHKVTAGRLKREGLKRGVPDIGLPVPRGEYHSLWIEMKFGKNKPTQHQERWMRFLKQQGHYVTVCYSMEEARDELLRYLAL